VSKYRYQLPLAIDLYKWGINFRLQRPILKKKIRSTPLGDDGSISIFLTMLEDND
jgi:hypothetical protein